MLLFYRSQIGQCSHTHTCIIHTYVYVLYDVCVHVLYQGMYYYRTVRKLGTLGREPKEFIALDLRSQY